MLVFVNYKEVFLQVFSAILAVTVLVGLYQEEYGPAAIFALLLIAVELDNVATAIREKK